MFRHKWGHPYACVVADFQEENYADYKIGQKVWSCPEMQHIPHVLMYNIGNHLKMNKEKFAWNRHCFDAGLYDPLAAGSIDGSDTIPHDKAIVRAMKATYQPKCHKSDKNRTLFIGRIPNDLSDETIKSKIEEYGGPLKSFERIYDIVTCRPRRYAFAEFKKISHMQRLLDRQYLKIDRDVLIVEREFARNLPGWIPRRLGGGIGGKRESGQLRFGGVAKPFKNPNTRP
ncbi:hypothetical protein GJ496_004813, partial [Pomphorhynchus laevis]